MFSSKIDWPRTCSCAYGSPTNDSEFVMNIKLPKGLGFPQIAIGQNYIRFIHKEEYDSSSVSCLWLLMVAGNIYEKVGKNVVHVSKRHLNKHHFDFKFNFSSSSRYSIQQMIDLVEDSYAPLACKHIREEELAEIDKTIERCLREISFMK